MLDGQTDSCSILTQKQDPSQMLDPHVCHQVDQVIPRMFCNILFNSIYIKMHAESNDEKIYNLWSCITITMACGTVSAPEQADMMKFQWKKLLQILHCKILEKTMLKKAWKLIETPPHLKMTLACT